VKQLLTRFVGFILVIGAILGLAFSIAGLVVVSRVERQVTARVLTGLDMLDRSLAATADGLSVADESLREAGDIVAATETATLGMSQTISDTIPLVNSVAALVGEDLPNSIGAAQTALDSAAASAKVVDDTLAVLATLAVLGGAEYAPPVPLHASIAQVSDSLDSLPASFSEMERGLNTTADNLARIETDVAGMADNIGQIDTSLAGAQSVIDQYQGVVRELQAELATIREGLPRWLHWLRWGISLTLVWLGIAQLGLLSQGLEMVVADR
jgi:methyl-accepting chemotaxis protein